MADKTGKTWMAIGETDDPNAVIESYEAEAADRIHSLVELIQPSMTLLIGGIVGLIAVTLMSAMTAMYGEGF